MTSQDEKIQYWAMGEYRIGASMAGAGVQKFDIDVRPYTSGIYFIHVKIDNKTIQKKVLKHKESFYIFTGFPVLEEV